MFNYTYNTGISDRRVTFLPPFKRLNYCNAAYYHIEKHTASKSIHKYAFVSYETPICRIVRYVDNVTNKDCFSIYVNRDSYRCSNSTIHQFVRFLRIAMGDLISYQAIKQYEGFTDIAIASYALMHLFFVDADTLHNAILKDNENTTPYWSAAYVKSVVRIAD